MRTRNLVLVALLFPVSLHAAEHTVSFTPATNAPAIARDRAIGLAERYLGLRKPGALPTGVTVTAEYGLATDSWIPFFKVANRPAWRVTFDGMAFSRKDEGCTVTNAYIHGLTALLDAETGTLLTVNSAPLVGTEPGSGRDSLAGLQLTPTTNLPRVAFLSAFAGWVGQNTRRFYAYYGDASRSSYGHIAGPAWFLSLSGVMQWPTPDLAPGRAVPPFVRSDDEGVVDAETGKWSSLGGATESFRMKQMSGKRTRSSLRERASRTHCSEWIRTGCTSLTCEERESRTCRH